jgi:putative PIN family toxin of toxin-antitoxin system
MGKNEPVKIILDTNWYISYLITGRPYILDTILTDDEVDILICDELVEEFNKIINYPRLLKYFSKSKARKYFRLIKSRCTFISISSIVTVCRDDKDNYLLSLAKDSSASYLITGDDDLLQLEKFETTIICTFTEFIGKYYKI